MTGERTPIDPAAVTADRIAAAAVIAVASREAPAAASDTLLATASADKITATAIIKR